MGYVIYYSLIALTLTIREKTAFIWAFTVTWFAFVGFRYQNGVDWFSTLAMIERGVENSDNFAGNFIGYSLVDSEILYKFVSLLIHELGLPPTAYVIIIAAINAILIFLLLNSSPNYKIAAIVIAAIFTLHFGFNAMRQGLALMAMVVAVRISAGKAKTVSSAVALTSHWASLPLISGALLYPRLKRYPAAMLLGLVLIAVVGQKYFPLELVLLRFGNAPAQYEISGFGFKFIFTLITSVIILIAIKPRYYKSLVFVLICFFAIVTVYNPMMRYYYFAIYGTILYSSSWLVKSQFSKALLLATSLSIAAFEWQEILRFIGCENCGDWFPYRSILFSS